MGDEKISNYLGRRTLFIGRLKCGKTRKTALILKKLIDAGLARRITVLDLAPEVTKGAGGKLACPAGDTIYLTAGIVAPRLTAKTPQTAASLALANARAIDKLLDRANELARPILIVNDASLYLQAGSAQRLIDLVNRASTVIANAYWGNDFPESELTSREKEQTIKLMRAFDKVMRTF